LQPPPGGRASARIFTVTVCDHYDYYVASADGWTWYSTLFRRATTSTFSVTFDCRASSDCNWLASDTIIWDHSHMYSIVHRRLGQPVSRHEREMAEVMHSLPECVRGGVSSVSVRILRMVLVLVLIFTAAWLPYAAVTLVGQFGSVGTLSQWVTALPAVFAKGSVVFNPIVYGIAHKHFRMTVRRLIQRNASSDGSSHRPARFNSVERRQVSTWRTSTSSHVTKTRIRRLKFQRHLLTWHESSGGIASSASVRRVSTGIDLQRRQSQRSVSVIHQPATGGPLTSGQPLANGRPMWLRSTNRSIPWCHTEDKAPEGKERSIVIIPRRTIHIGTTDA
ncbi:rhodopsin, GQ-coupled-like, partial [Pollicipes pollicipes]|uniref:rhodopsin, GQ-coupled-like n=1 Tax=Pollicipes pollicipes TaxID=41117 RepID=UPI001884AA6E